MGRRLYPSGYRYPGQPIDQPSDNDARQYPVAASLLEVTGERYTATASFTQLNRGGARDESNWRSLLALI